jgi:hypothetical protein
MAASAPVESVRILFLKIEEKNLRANGTKKSCQKWVQNWERRRRGIHTRL